MLIERWASQEDLDARVAAAQARPRAAGTAVSPNAALIFVYDVRCRVKSRNSESQAAA
jgi:hypothetical protein